MKKINIINIDGKQFSRDDCNETQNQLIEQISMCQFEINNIANLIKKIDIYKKAKILYQKELLDSLEKS